jgi:hypothetical protein
MPRRALIGPLLVALASWCAAGLITVQHPDATAVRLAAPAPLWVAAAAFLVAFALPAWRVRPLTAAPALLSTLPWWPVPLPAIALLWTGPLAWAPVLAALLAALLASRTEAPSAERSAVAPVRSALLAGALGLVVSLLAAWSLAPRLPGGDEPHYLVIAQSLLRDGDLDIRNNHAAREYASYYPGELRPDYLRPGRRGEIYSIHAPGIPALVLPGFALFGYRGAQGTLLLFGACTGAAIWWLGWITTRSGSAAWFAWAAIALAPTFLIQSVTIFPDGPAALCVAAAVWLLIRLGDAEHGPRPAAMILVGAMLAALPWLHTRFAVLAGVLGLAIAGSIAVGRHATRRWLPLLAFLAIPLAGAAAWFVSFYVLYGTFDPTAPYGAPSADRSSRFIPGGVAGLLFDQQFGLLSYGPALLIAGAGSAFAAWRRCGAVVWSLSAAACYLAVTATYWMWWGGVPAPPARFAMAVLPVLAVPLALAWSRFSGPARAVALFALAWSLAIAVCVIGIGRGALAWNIRDGQAAWLEWLSPVVNLPRGWPSFFWRLTPADVSTEWPFALHALIWLATLGLAAMATVLVTSRLVTRGVAAGAPVATGLLIALMAVVQAGWWLNGSTGLDPSRSQLALLDRIGPGGAVTLIGPLDVRAGAGSVASMRVEPEERPRFRPELPWAFYTGVPSGDYELSVTSASPRAGTLTISTERAPEPIAVHQLVPLARQTVALPLPGGASVLTLEVDAGLKDAGVRVELRRK